MGQPVNPHRLPEPVPFPTRDDTELIKVSTQLEQLRRLICQISLLSLLGNGTGKPAGIAPVTRTRTRRTILPENPRVTRQNEPKNIEIGQVLREIYSK